MLNAMRLSYLDEGSSLKLLIAYDNSKFVELMLNYQGSDNF